MREIKFRAWDKENKIMLKFEDEWYEKEHVGKQVVKAIMYSPIFGDQENVLKITYFENMSKYNFSVEELDAIPLQYTGLKDKNGKEIYEGDIVHFNTLGGNNMYYEVRWSDAKTGFKPTRLTKTNQAEIEIIGNIYENPELLADKE